MSGSDYSPSLNEGLDSEFSRPEENYSQRKGVSLDVVGLCSTPLSPTHSTTMKAISMKTPTSRKNPMQTETCIQG